jgi:hypothetical protein
MVSIKESISINLLSSSVKFFPDNNFPLISLFDKLMGSGIPIIVTLFVVLLVLVNAPKPFLSALTVYLVPFSKTIS